MALAIWGRKSEAMVDGEKNVLKAYSPSVLWCVLSCPKGQYRSEAYGCFFILIYFSQPPLVLSSTTRNGLKSE